VRASAERVKAGKGDRVGEDGYGRAGPEAGAAHPKRELMARAIAPARRVVPTVVRGPPTQSTPSFRRWATQRET
jgi:hypothetical protein